MGYHVAIVYKNIFELFQPFFYYHSRAAFCALFDTSRGEANVVQLKTCFLHKGHVAIVMPYFPHDRFAVSCLTCLELKCWN